MVRAGIRAVPSARGRRRAADTRLPARPPETTDCSFARSDQWAYVMHATKALVQVQVQADRQVFGQARAHHSSCSKSARWVGEEYQRISLATEKEERTPPIRVQYNSCFDLQCGSTLQTRKGSRKSQ